MLIKVQNEAPFQVLTGAFTIGPSETGYELQVGATPRNFTTLFSVGANTTRMVTNVANGSYYRLKNNVGEVTVNWSKTCVEPGGSGGSGTELSPVTEFPEGAEAGTVVAYNGTASASGVYQYTGEEWVPVGVDDLSAYWTSAQTQSAITIVEDHLYDVEQVTASALTELHEGLVEVSGRTVDLSGYYTSAQTEDAISAATSGKADAASVSANTSSWRLPYWNEQGVIIGDQGINWTNSYIYTNQGNLTRILADRNRNINIYTPTRRGEAGEFLVGDGTNVPKWSAMTFPTPDVDKAYVDSAITGVQDQIDVIDNVVSEAILDLKSGATELEARVDENEEVTAASLADLENKINTIDEVISAAVLDLNERKVSSSSISTIWKGTQAEYDAIASKDPATFYIIINS